MPPIMEKQEELLNLLVQDGLINIEQITQAGAKAKDKNISLLDVLVESKFIDAEDLVKEKAKLFKLPYISLLEKKVEESVLNIVSSAVAENYKIVCFEKNESTIKVGLVNPENFKAMEAVDFLAKKDGLHVEYYLISDVSHKAVLRQYKTLSKEISSALEVKAEEDKAKKKQKLEEEKDLEDVTKSAPVAKIVSVIMRHAIDGGASDIHIEPLKNESRVRYRIDGILRTSLVLPKDVHEAVVARIKVMANLKLDETRIPQDGRIRVSFNDKDVDLRISTLPLVGEEKVVMRILDVSRGAPTLEDLGFFGPGLEIVRRNIQRTDGMFLVTGPTGSGKSTTLFSVLNEMNKEGVNISTLEDPVEYFIKGVNQSQVRPEVGFSFVSGLRSLLRQDPDVIMVGEIRDNETAELAIHASLTGHFVLSTLHTNDAIGAIPRLLDMKVEPFLLISTLNTIVAQRLGRKICPHCKREEKPSEEVAAKVLKDLAKAPPALIKKVLPDFNPSNLIFYKGQGCPRCGNTGYSGRIAITEVIDINDKMKEVIMKKSAQIELADVMASQEFLTLYQDGLIKVIKGATTMEEIMRVVFD